MALGHMAEVLIVRELERNGWETRHTVLSEEGQLALELEIPGAGEMIKGHPDGICRHPQFTRNMWVTLECKSMSPERAEEVQREGITKVYPGHLTQISLYGRRLKEMNLVSHAERGIFGMMDREGRLLPPERVVGERREVDRPHPQSSTECRYCNYHTHCWGTDPEPEKTLERRTATSQEPLVIEAARTWAELKPQVDRARGMLQAVSNSNGRADVVVGG